MLVVSGRTEWEGVTQPPERASLVFKEGMLFEGGPQPSPEEIERIRAAMPISLATLRYVGSSVERPDSGFVGTGAIWTSPTTFTMKLPPGRYVSEGHSGRGWLIKSFRIDGREMTGRPVEILFRVDQRRPGFDPYGWSCGDFDRRAGRHARRVLRVRALHGESASLARRGPVPITLRRPGTDGRNRTLLD